MATTRYRYDEYPYPNLDLGHTRRVLSQSNNYVHIGILGKDLDLERQALGSSDRSGVAIEKLWLRS